MALPTTARTAPALTKTKPADPRRLVRFNAKVPSLGLTLTTPWGPVDLVAVERAVRGHDVTLTRADFAWLTRRTHHSYGRRLAADLLGIERGRFDLLIRRWRAANLPTTDRNA